MTLTIEPATGSHHPPTVGDPARRARVRDQPPHPVPTPHRMEEDGLLGSTREVVEGRTRRVHTVASAGRRDLRDAKRLLAELADEVLDR